MIIAYIFSYFSKQYSSYVVWSSVPSICLDLGTCLYLIGDFSLSNVYIDYVFSILNVLLGTSVGDDTTVIVEGKDQEPLNQQWMTNCDGIWILMNAIIK